MGRFSKNIESDAKLIAGFVKQFLQYFLPEQKKTDQEEVAAAISSLRCRNFVKENQTVELLGVKRLSYQAMCVKIRVETLKNVAFRRA